MNNNKNFLRYLSAGTLILMVTSVNSVGAAQQSMSSVTEQAQIRPIGDGSEKYVMKSDGFYCLDISGGRSTAAEVHYFDDFEIDGTVLNGYYYHDTDGKFKACSSHMEHLKSIPVYKEQTEEKLDGFYFVNNLGKLSAAPQVRYIDNLTLDGTVLNGYYYFDEDGKMVTDPGIHHLEMNCYTQNFDGNYYFGGSNGALLQESTTTPDGFVVDETGKVINLDELGIENLKPQLESMLSGYEGTWSVYIKNLNENKEMVINDQPLYSASLIKAFVMAATYENMEQVKADEGKKLNTTDEKTIDVKIDDLLWNMITVSDNESHNELVKLQTDTLDFKKGAELINRWLEKEGYTETTVQHTLHPSASAKESLGGKSTTSVKDCGTLLEKIYRKKCVSEDASDAMLNLLTNQQETWKIPQGLPEGIVSANKTGETDQDQHDIAIVFGEKTTYILCIMSENCPEGTAVINIQNLSKMVYNYLNL